MYTTGVHLIRPILQQTHLASSWWRAKFSVQKWDNILKAKAIRLLDNHSAFEVRRLHVHIFLKHTSHVYRGRMSLILGLTNWKDICPIFLRLPSRIFRFK